MTAPPTFAERFNGKFWGVLRWTQYDSIFAKVAETPEGWYVWHTPDPVPSAPCTADGMTALFRRFDEKFATERARDSLGFVYVDDMEAPTFIKVFDPMKMGGCGGGGKAKPPEWLLTTMPPEEIEEAHEKQVHKPLFDRLLGK